MNNNNNKLTIHKTVMFDVIDEEGDVLWSFETVAEARQFIKETNQRLANKFNNID